MSSDNTLMTDKQTSKSSLLPQESTASDPFLCANNSKSNGLQSHLTISPQNRTSNISKISPGSKSLSSSICTSPPLPSSPKLSSLNPLPSPLCMLQDLPCKQGILNNEEMKLPCIDDSRETTHKTQREIPLLQNDSQSLSSSFTNINDFPNVETSTNTSSKSSSYSTSQSNDALSKGIRSNIQRQEGETDRSTPMRSGQTLSSIASEVSSACATTPTLSAGAKRGVVSRRGGRAGLITPIMHRAVSLSSNNTSPSSQHRHNFETHNGRDSTPSNSKPPLSAHNAMKSYPNRDQSQVPIAASPHSFASIVTASETNPGIQLSSSSSSFSPSISISDKKSTRIEPLANSSENNDSSFSSKKCPLNNHPEFSVTYEQTQQRENDPNPLPSKMDLSSQFSSETMHHTSTATNADKGNEQNLGLKEQKDNLKVEPMSIDEDDRNNVTRSESPTSNLEENRLVFLSPTPSHGFCKKSDGIAKPDSPCALFLSPYSPTSLGVIGDSPFVKGSSSTPRDALIIGENMSIPLMSPTPSTTKRERTETETPTNFVNELENANPSFSWLNSPSIFPLTPKSCPDTQGSTSITVFASPKPPANTSEKDTDTKAIVSRTYQGHTYSSMICISPLASSKKQNRDSNVTTGQSCRSPLKRESNGKSTMEIFQEIFASPRPSISNQNVSPSPKNLMPLDFNSKTDYDSSLNLDIHMAERDLMEDEDLSVLLQLASNSSASSGRSPIAYLHKHRQRNGFPPATGAALSSLQLPMINESRATNSESPRLSRANLSRDFSGNQQQGRMSRSDDFYLQKKDEHNQIKSVGFSTQDMKPLKRRKSANIMLQPKYEKQVSFTHYRSDQFVSKEHQNGNPTFNGQVPLHGENPTLTPAVTSNHLLHNDTAPGHIPSRACQQPASYHVNYEASNPPHHPMPEMMSSQHAYHPMNEQKPLPQVAPISLTPYADQLKKKPPPPPRRSTSESGKGRRKQRSHPTKPKRQAGQSKSETGSNKMGKDNSSNFPTIDLAATAASGGKNAQAAALAAAILRGVTMRPSGKWQAQLYYAGKSRYIGVFDSREKAALAYEIAREKLKSEGNSDLGSCVEDTDTAVKLAREAAFAGVNEPDHRLLGKR